VDENPWRAATATSGDREFERGSSGAIAADVARGGSSSGAIEVAGLRGAARANGGWPLSSRRSSTIGGPPLCYLAPMRGAMPLILRGRIDATAVPSTVLSSSNAGGDETHDATPRPPLDPSPHLRGRTSRPRWPRPPTRTATASKTASITAPTASIRIRATSTVTPTAIAATRTRTATPSTTPRTTVRRPPTPARKIPTPTRSATPATAALRPPPRPGHLVPFLRQQRSGSHAQWLRSVMPAGTNRVRKA
jgi:hypothetical protein